MFATFTRPYIDNYSNADKYRSEMHCHLTQLTSYLVDLFTVIQDKYIYSDHEEVQDLTQTHGNDVTWTSWRLDLPATPV